MSNHILSCKIPHSHSAHPSRMAFPPTMPTSGLGTILMHPHILGVRADLHVAAAFPSLPQSAAGLCTGHAHEASVLRLNLLSLGSS